MNQNTMPDDDDMPSEIDFTDGKRGKFHRASMRLHLPVYLEQQVQERLAQLARATGIQLSTLVNELLKKDIELMERGW